MAENLKKDPSAIILPFGKHKGKTVAELLAVDPHYADWVSAQAWVAERFAELHSAIISRGAGIDDSPEHNALQGRFLDPLFRAWFFRVARPRDVANSTKAAIREITEAREEPMRGLLDKIREQEGRIEWKTKAIEQFSTRDVPETSPFYKEHVERPRSYKADIVEAGKLIEGLQGEVDRIQKEIDKLDDLNGIAPKISSEVTFESRGVDVVARGWVHVTTSHGEKSTCMLYDAKVELKPTLGDEYPTVIRQMRRLEADVLVVGMYTGRGVSEPQMRVMFGSSGIRVVFLQEIEEEMRKAATPEWW